MLFHNIICKNFISTFLPPVKNNRKYSTNEGAYVIRAICEIYYYFSNYKLAPEDVISCLRELDYKFLETNYEIVDGEELIRADGGYSKSFRVGNQMIDSFYINISAPELRTLRKAIKKMPDNTSKETLQKVTEYKENMSTFFKKELKLDQTKTVQALYFISKYEEGISTKDFTIGFLKKEITGSRANSGNVIIGAKYLGRLAAQGYLMKDIITKQGSSSKYPAGHYYLTELGQKQLT